MDADGFTVGTALETNAATVAHHYVGFNDVANSIDASSYLGDGVDNRNVATPGFQPEFVLDPGRRQRHEPARHVQAVVAGRRQRAARSPPRRA